MKSQRTGKRTRSHLDKKHGGIDCDDEPEPALVIRRKAGVTQSRHYCPNAVDRQFAQPDSPRMALVRTVLAVVIALGVATVPANSGPVVSTSTAAMSMADEADMPCCPPSDEHKDSTACAFKCLTFVAAMFPTVVGLAHIIGGVPPSLADVTLQGHKIPPTHPPPI